MLKAIIFDFDGIIADTEPTHYEAFKTVLADIGIVLTKEDYYEKYLAYDDKKLFEQVLVDNGKTPEFTEIDTLISRKAVMMTDLFTRHVTLFPGFLSFLDQIRDRYALAIGSGALKAEIKLVLEKFNIDKEFKALTAADDVNNCKPDPEVFIKSLKSLNLINGNKIAAEECLVIEDSVYGIRAAKSANMKCLALCHTYDKDLLHEADIVKNNYSEVDIDLIENIF